MCWFVCCTLPRIFVIHSEITCLRHKKWSCFFNPTDVGWIRSHSKLVLLTHVWSTQLHIDCHRILNEKTRRERERMKKKSSAHTSRNRPWLNYSTRILFFLLFVSLSCSLSLRLAQMWYLHKNWHFISLNHQKQSQSHFAINDNPIDL